MALVRTFLLEWIRLTDLNTTELENQLLLKPLPRWLVAMMLVLGTCSISAASLSPWLLTHHPTVLIMLDSDVIQLVLASPQVGFWPALLIGVVRRGLGMFMVFSVTSHFGPTGLTWAGARWPFVSRLIQLLERLMRRIGAPLLLLAPAYGTTMLAGAAGMKLRTFLPTMIVGQLILVSVVLNFGVAVSDWTAPILHFLRENVVAATAVAATLVLSYQLWTRVIRPRMGQTPTANQES